MLTAKNLSSLFNVRPGEGKLVLSVYLFAFFSYLADSFLITVSYARFLSVFDADAIPAVYIGISIVGTLISLAYLRFETRLGLARTILASRVLFLFLTAGIWPLQFAGENRWLLALLPVLQGVYQNLAMTTFWNLLGRLFDLQQAKRLFGMLGSSATVGYMVGGALTPLLVRTIGTANLLGLAALAMGIAWWLGWRITHAHAARFSGSSEDETNTPTAAGTASTSLWRDPYIVRLIAGYAFFIITACFIDTLFYVRANVVYPSEEAMASFLGIFGAVGSLASLLVEYFGTGRFLARYGVPRLVLLSPALFLGLVLLNSGPGALGGSAIVLFGLIALTNVVTGVLGALDTVSVNLLYQPLPAVQRTRVQTFLDGIVYPVATGIGGGLLLILLQLLAFGPELTLALLLPLLVVWLLIAYRLARAYPERLRAALRDRILQAAPRGRPDAAGVAALQAGLGDPEPGPALYAFGMWQQLLPEELPQQLPGLLRHPAPAVQLAVLAHIEQTTHRAALPDVQRLAASTDSATLRGAALRVLAVIGGEDGLEEVAAHLDDPRPEVRRGSLVGLLKSGELEGVMLAGERLTTLLLAPASADRVFAAQVLGESELASVYRPVLRLLNDPDARVQRAALQAAGRLQHPRLWHAAIAAVERSTARAAATAALVQGGGNALPAVAAAIAGLELSATARVRLIRVLGRRRSAAAVEPLLAQLAVQDVTVRGAALHALQQCDYRADAATAPGLHALFREEIGQAAWLLAALTELDSADPPPATALVQNALLVALRRLQTRLFGLLALLYDPGTVRKASDALGLRRMGHLSVSAEQRSYALELIELFVPRELSSGLLPLISDSSPQEQLALLEPPRSPLPGDSSGWLTALATADPGMIGPWLRAIALYAAQSTALNLPPAALAAARSDPDALVRETAHWIGRTDYPDAPSHPYSGEPAMLLTIEKALLLKSVDLFGNTPDEILVAVAERLQEITFPAETTVFERGELGDSLYIVVSGAVEVHDSEHILDRLGPRQVFGEMALLDTQPRAASVRTAAATRLLRLDHEAFYELMDDHIEIARGVIQMLLGRLRARMVDLKRLQDQIASV